MVMLVWEVAAGRKTEKGNEFRAGREEPGMPKGGRERIEQG
jgi:hypothetical protein